MRAWQVTTYGRPTDALECVEVDDPDPGPGELLVRTTASVLNYNEVDGCHGRYLTVNPPLPYTLGMECVGEVVGTGPGAEGWMGHRVTASGTGATGAHADFVVASAAMTFEAPEQLDDVHAAAFFFPFHLAYLGLHERGRLRSGETVLVHAAAGGVGSAAVQLAVAAGARVIAGVGRADKADVVRRLGADTVIDTRQANFAEVVLDETDGHGVDVCFDGVGGSVTTESLRCLAGGGRQVIFGFASGVEAEEVPLVPGRTLCFGNFDLVGVILAYVDRGVPDGPARTRRPGFNPPTRDVGDRVQAELLTLLEGGRIRPLIGATKPFDELPQALEDMEDRNTIGRVVIRR